MKKNYAIGLLAICVMWSCKQKAPIEKPIDAWYKHLVIYNLDVKSFKDSNGDGKGDFKGLTSKLDYLKTLGVNAIWLAPFQPSPLKDDGYDISDYKAIDSSLGTTEDFKEFIKQVKAKHLYIFMDIVLNHTSIQHPWFRQRHDWYVWSNDRPSDWNKGMGFPVVENDSWHFDSTSKQYYFHRFYQFEPDLNYQNPAVVKEAKSVLTYWLKLGMDGFRLDAVPFIIDDPRKNSANPRFDYNILNELTSYIRKKNPHVLLLGEANVDPDENTKYFSKGKSGLQMMFNFYANQYLFWGLTTGNTAKLKKALIATRVKPGMDQWAWFLRNHDEIDLGRLSKNERLLVYKKMGPDSGMQLYNRGIRRRLATMLGNDPRQIRFAYSLLFALPGTPVIRVGEKLGMGDDLRLKERLAIRTPMQWDSTTHGGFTTGNPFRPVIDNWEYGYQRLNVAKQTQDPQSLLNFIRALIKRRKSFREIDNGQWQILNTPDVLLALLYNDKGKQVLIVHNFSDQPQEFKGKKIIISGYGADWQRL